MQDLGDIQLGQTVYVPFETYGSNGESITMTGLAVTDIEVYKNGSVTQRASDAGYSLLDTDGTDIDGATGLHGFSIDTSDNTDAGFWDRNSEYWVAVNAVTINTQTVRFWAARFSIERGPIAGGYRTTIATLATQTSFTLTDGPADDDALNGRILCIKDQTTPFQMAHAIVLDYTGTTKTVTLDVDPAIYTMAVGDTVEVLPPVGVVAMNGNIVIGAGTSGDKWRGQ